MDRLNTLVHNKMDEIERWKQKLASCEAELSKLDGLQNDLAHYESKINMGKAENDRLNGLLKARLEELEAWKRKNQDLEGALSQMNFMAEEKRML